MKHRSLDSLRSLEMTDECSFGMTDECSFGTTEGCSFGMTDGCSFEMTEGCSFGMTEGCSLEMTDGCSLGRRQIRTPSILPSAKASASDRSLAIRSDLRKSGIGRKLVAKAIARLDEELGNYRLFALTLQPGFFERLGFEVVEKELFPEKIWADCSHCPKRDRCDEIAVIYYGKNQ